MKQVKRAAIYFVLLLIVAAFVTPFFSSIPVAHADTGFEPYNYKTNGAKLIGNDYNFNVGDEDDFTPFDEEFSQRQAGKSWSPATKTISTELLGEIIEHEYIEDELLLFDAPMALDLTGKSIYFWVYFDEYSFKEHYFYLRVSETDYLQWTINTASMESLFKKTDASEIDIAVYGTGEDGEGIPLGWNMVELPISAATRVGTVGVDSDTFDAFGVGQSEDPIFENAVLIYDVYLNDSTSLIIKNHASQGMVLYKVSPLNIKEHRKYYAGEIFDRVPTFNQLFNTGAGAERGYFWIGKVDFSQFDTFAEYEDLFKITFSEPDGGKTVSSLGGSGVNSLKPGGYVVSYLIYPNNSSAGDGISQEDEILFYWFNFNVGNYGQGIWFIDSSLPAILGETYTIRYKIHDAFYEEQFMNEVGVAFQDDGVLELVEHNKAQNTITVKVVGTGTTSIKLILTSGRLSPTYTAYDKIENNSFVINATAPQEESNTIEILLWVSLSIVVAIGIGFGIKAIIDARKIEVK